VYTRAFLAGNAVSFYNRSSCPVLLVSSFLTRRQQRRARAHDDLHPTRERREFVHPAPPGHTHRLFGEPTSNWFRAYGERAADKRGTARERRGDDFGYAASLPRVYIYLYIIIITRRTDARALGRKPFGRRTARNNDNVQGGVPRIPRIPNRTRRVVGDPVKLTGFPLSIPLYYNDDDDDDDGWIRFFF